MKIDYKNRKILIIAVVAAVINAVLIYQLLYTTKKKAPPTILYKLPLPTPTSSLEPRALSRKRIATFSLIPSTVNTGLDESFTLTINLTTAFPLIGADAVLHFNPEMLAVEKVNAGEMFSLYPRLTYDNNNGQIIITGIKTPGVSDVHRTLPGVKNTGNFATLTLRAKQPGPTQVQFDFEYGQTTGSTAVKAEYAKNILSHVENATIKIE